MPWDAGNRVSTGAIVAESTWERARARLLKTTPTRVDAWSAEDIWILPGCPEMEIPMINIP